MISRRTFVTGAVGVAASLLAGCRPPASDAPPVADGAPSGPDRLQARSTAATAGAGPTGLQPLGLDPDRDGFVFVPSAAASGGPRPLILMLHGAGGNGRAGLAPFLDGAEDAGVILVGPDSRRQTWDAIRGGYGADVGFINRALEQTFQRYAVDPGQVGVEGFSDGASYALGIGLANGDLFSRVIAFSPGFWPQGGTEGRPKVFVSHGTADEVLPIDRCSRRIVPALRQRGYDIRYHEFEGGHEVPAPITAEAMTWLRG
ncbi:MAG: alpha/beta hydrolase-fold protein [Actinomycetota bacterium]|nr:alpha/beta hydrolase-fold protein [Actinomycetota bacterium]